MVRLRVTSTPADFRKLAPEVLHKIIEASGTEILVPYMEISIRINESLCGIVTKDIVLMNGLISNIEATEDDIEINCIIEPQYWNNYILKLNSITSGKADYKINSIIYEERRMEKRV